MKTLIGSIFLALSGLSVIALLTQPKPPHPEKLGITRTTDFHPRRSVELAKFNAANPELWLTIDTSGNQLQKIIVQSSSGVGADLFDVYNGSQLQTLAEAGVISDVTPEAKELGFSVDGDTWPAVRGELSDQGKQYSYPANVNANILVFNKAIFRKMGVPFPKQNITWDEFWPMAQKLTKRDGKNSVFGVVQFGWGSIFQSLRGQYFNKDGTKLLLTSDALKTSLQAHKDMIYKYRVSPSSLELKALSGQGGYGAGGINQFADGRFAMIGIGKWALTNFRSAYRDQKEKLAQWEKNPSRQESEKPMVLELGSVMMPHFEGKPQCFKVESRSTAVNALGPHRKQALQFLKFLASKEYSEIVNGGVDALPGNPKYVNAGLEPGEPALSELEMHRNTVEALKYGYQPIRSPFLLSSDVERVLGEQLSRLESDPNLPVEDLLAAAQNDAQILMQRNLDRSPKLRESYKALTGSERVVAQ
ncbi:extracellular solute-binding protein [bacterium]|nr:MAG: extracellular solute-binding protein [bacterium]